MRETVIFKFDDFTLCPREYSLKKNGKKIHLRPKVIDTLAYLVEHSEILIKKDELLTNIWPDVIVTDNALNHCIDEIRRALGDNARAPTFIETVPRLGYKFISNVEIVHTTSPSSLASAHISRQIQTSGDSDSTEYLQHKQRSKRKDLRFLILNLIPAIALVLVLVLVLRGNTSFTDSDAVPVSLAVLPFINLSDTSEQDFFVDGMTEEMISTLSKIHGLEVIARTSVMKYKNSQESIVEIANELNVGQVLDGSVRKNGNMLRISVQLIDAKNQVTVWSAEYDRALKNVFAIQTDIAQGVAKAMKIRLQQYDKLRLGKQPTEILEAYILYLKGRHELNKRTEAGIKKGFEYFTRATELDPEYAPAYTGLADAYSYFAIYHIIPGPEAFPLAKLYAMRALSLNDQIAEAHVSLAMILEGYYWNWADARQEYLRALSINPNLASAHKEYSEYLMFTGNFEDAISEAKQALKLDPFSVVMNGNLGHVLYRARRYDEAVEQLEKTLAMVPGELLTVPLWHLGLAYIQKGEINHAIKELEKFRIHSKNNPDLLAILGYAYARASMKDEALKVLEDVKSHLKEPDVFFHFDLPVDLALINTGLGENETALRWLEKAYSERATSLVFLKTEPFLDPLRSDPGFITLLKKMDLN